MKKIVIGFAILLLASIGLLHAQTYEATISQAINGSYLDVTLYLRHTGSVAPILGDCSFYINFDNTALTWVGLQADGQWDIDHNAGYDHNLSSSFATLASCEIVMNGTPTYQMPSSATQLGVIRFTITDPNQYSGVSWNTMFTEVYDSGDSDISGNGTFTNPGNFSLPVQMSSMEAESTHEGVVLSWETASELNSQGFHIWRSDELEGNYERITTSLIQSEGNNSAGAQYTFTDRNFEGSVTYYYKIQQLDTEGGSMMFEAIEVLTLFIPEEFQLTQNYPNPFNPVTTFVYDVPEVSDVVIKVYSLLGKEVKTIYNEQQLPGRYTETWDGTDNTGQRLASGVYFLRMHAKDFTKMRKMTLLR